MSCGCGPSGCGAHKRDESFDPDFEGPSADDIARFGGDDIECPDCGASVYHDAPMCPRCGYALGAADYLTKPIERERLVAALKKHRRDLPVLVVDDDATLRQLLRRMLEPEGYTVVEAENGRVALERLRDMSPSVVLLDLMMPEMDGFEFAVEFRRHEAWRAVPIVVITARDLSREDHERLNGYVQKILQKGTHGRDQLLLALA